jgi:hypothetical protein
MSGTYNTNEVMRNTYKIQLENVKKGDHLGDLAVDARIMLTFILKE